MVRVWGSEVGRWCWRRVLGSEGGRGGDGRERFVVDWCFFFFFGMDGVVEEGGRGEEWEGRESGLLEKRKEKKKGEEKKKEQAIIIPKPNSEGR